MQITFDPFDDIEVNTVHKIMAAVSGVTTESHGVHGGVRSSQEPQTATVDANTPVGGVTVAPVGDGATAPEVTPVTGDTDVHGMPWNEAIHSTPPAKNNDGSWRAKRNCKKEYEAAIAAHKAGQTAAAGETMTQTPAPLAMSVGGGGAVVMPGAPGMPAPTMPAAPAPQTPPEPIAYEDMAHRFVGLMESQVINDYETVYRDLQIDHNQVETNQTMITRLWQYMDATQQGVPHPQAVGMVMANAAG